MSTYIILGCILLRQKVPDSVANIPLHVRHAVTQMAIAIKVYSLNEPIMAIVPYCYPVLMALTEPKVYPSYLVCASHLNLMGQLEWIDGTQIVS